MKKYKVKRSSFLNWYFRQYTIEARVRRRLQRNKDGVATISVQELLNDCDKIPSLLADGIPLSEEWIDTSEVELIF